MKAPISHLRANKQFSLPEIDQRDVLDANISIDSVSVSNGSPEMKSVKSRGAKLLKRDELNYHDLTKLKNMVELDLSNYKELPDELRGTIQDA